MDNFDDIMSMEINDDQNNISENVYDEDFDIMKMEIYDDYLNEFGQWAYFAPDNVTANDFFKEMAEIYPKYNEEHNIKKNRFKVAIVQGGEGPVPHAHVYFEHKGSKEDIAYICLGKAEYAPQHIKETKILNSHERKALQEFFNTYRKGAATLNKDGNFIPCNCWQECVDIWMQTYKTDPNKYFEIDENTGFYVMPDYTKLSLDK